MKIVSPFVVRSLLTVLITLGAAGCGGDTAEVVVDEATLNDFEASPTSPPPEPSADTAAVTESEPEPEPEAADDQASGFFDVVQARELPARAGGWGYVHAPPFGAVEPTLLPELDPFWISCREGDGGACEDLYNLAWDEITFETSNAAWEPYFNFAATCGGRRVDLVEPCTELLPGERTTDVEGVDRVKFKPEVTPFWLSSPLEGQSFDLRHIPAASTPAPGTVPELDALWTSCGAGDGVACDQLFEEGASFLVPEGVYSLFGATCGGRTSLVDVCEILLAPPERQVAPNSPAPGFEPAKDALLEACGAGDGPACWELKRATEPFDSESPELQEENWPYWHYAMTCGGQADRPTILPGCFDYQAWPVVDEIGSLPLPPDY